MVSLTEIVGVVGGIAGLLSLTLIIYKTIRERPRVSCEVSGKPYIFNPRNESDNFVSFSVSVKFHNKGSRPTTVHNCNLEFEYKNKNFVAHTGSSNTFQIDADSTRSHYFNFHINKEKGPFREFIENSVLRIQHTFGEIKLIIGKIYEST